MDKIKLQEYADFIRTVPQEKFDMSSGTRCVVGHINKKYGNEGRHLSRALQGEDKQPYELQLNYIINPLWAKVDNTPAGAANRIEDIIKSGIPPEGFLKQLNPECT